MASPGIGGTRSPRLGDRSTNYDAGAWTDKDRFESEVTNYGRNQEAYLRGELLGLGSWSRVYKVRRTSDGEIFAGKTCRTPHLMRREAQILKSISHDHFLKFVDWDDKRGQSDDALLVTELCVGGTLQQRIDDTSKGLPGHEALDLLAQIASALDHLHSNGRFHSDVKPRNILIRRLNPLQIVLGDCADIKSVASISDTRPRGTPAYFSPEILHLNRCHGTSDDMWALGITMLGMIGQWPQMEYTRDGLRAYPKKCHDHVVLLKQLNSGDELVEGLLAKLLAWDVKSRMKAQDCVVKAKELRDSEKWGDEKVNLAIPDDFKPISFW